MTHYAKECLEEILSKEGEKILIESSKPWTFEDALEHFHFIKNMRNDLPDGQWESLKDELLDVFGDENDKLSLSAIKESEQSKDIFISIVKNNVSYWI